MADELKSWQTDALKLFDRLDKLTGSSIVQDATNTRKEFDESQSALQGLVSDVESDASQASQASVASLRRQSPP